MRRSRRGLLGAGFGVAAIGALMSTGRAAAANGETVLSGGYYSTTSATVFGSTGTALSATTSATNAYAFFGVSSNASGGTAIGGEAAGVGTGVLGDSESGTGVRGQTHGTGTGVYGVSAGGVGVAGSTTGGTGVQAVAGANGVALDVYGRVRLDRAGVSRVRSGRSTVTVAVPGGVTGATFALATLGQRRPGVHVEAAVLDPSADTLRITLNKAVTADTKVSWIVLR